MVCVFVVGGGCFSLCMETTGKEMACGQATPDMRQSHTHQGQKQCLFDLTVVASVPTVPACYF